MYALSEDEVIMILCYFLQPTCILTSLPLQPAVASDPELSYSEERTPQEIYQSPSTGSQSFKGVMKGVPFFPLLYFCNSWILWHEKLPLHLKIVCKESHKALNH